MKKKVFKRVVVGLFAVGFILVFRMFAVATPESKVGFALFRWSYDVSASKTAALQGFDANLKSYNGGYIPDEIDTFLHSRLENTHSPKEFDAIVDFYAFKAGGREGMNVFTWPAKTKEKATASILSRMDNYSTNHAASALVLIEDMRQGKGDNLGKANLISDAPVSGMSGEKYPIWLQQKGVPEAKALYRKWWNSYPTWEEKTKHDPLEKSHLRIQGL